MTEPQAVAWEVFAASWREALAPNDGGPMRTIDAAVADAQARGAVTEESARWWLAQGQDAVETVDMLAGSPVLAAAAAPHSRQVVTDGGGPGPVAAAAAPPGADPALYGANPILDEMRGLRPELVRAAMAENPNVPRLFGSADLPPFTASGLDPAHLAAQPWPIRRAMAEAPTRAAAYELAAKYADNPGMAKVDHQHSPANASYVASMSTWLAGAGKHPADRARGVAASAADEFTTEQLHRELFGPRADPWSE
jgi:hypothetical protein